MTEIEIHSLLIASRAEFDLMTVIYFFVFLVFIFLAIYGKGKLDKIQVNCLVLTYLLMAAFLVIRIIAAINRFINLSRLLRKSFDPIFDPTFIPLQLPTLYSRMECSVILNTFF